MKLAEFEFDCEIDEPLIALLAYQRDKEKNPCDELLLHSGGPITDLSENSMLPILDSIRILLFEPEHDVQVEIGSALAGEVTLGQPEPLVMLTQEWDDGRWKTIDESRPINLDAALSEISSHEITPSCCASLEQLCEHEKLPVIPGGFAGLLGYDLARWTNDVHLANLPIPGTLLGVLWRADAWWIHERESEKLRLLALEHHKFSLNPSMPNLQPPLIPSRPNSIVPQSETDASHAEKVEMIRDSIRGGHLYQVNYGRRWSAEMPDDPWDVFLRLSRSNPAPFASWMHVVDHGWAVASSSPERLLKVESGKVSTRPIKGTRARGSTREKDQQLRVEMAASEKEIAEHLMLVDLERHDLGRVCKTGTVHWSDWRIEALPTVQHLVSGIEGELDEGVSIISALSALFPGGSITGCPKTVTIAAIDELEGAPRSAWTGSIGHIHSVLGRAEFNILIRTLEAHSGPRSWHGRVQAGGGIVIGSDAADEVEEARWKAAAVTSATWDFKTGFEAKELPEREIGMLPVPVVEGLLGRIAPYSGGELKGRSDSKVLIVDNLDSFTENIADMLVRLGASVHIVEGRPAESIDEVEQVDAWLNEIQPTHIILGPGPSRPEVSAVTMELAKRAVLGELLHKGAHIPLLGWCLGHQALGRAVGWELVESPLGAVHGVPSRIIHDGEGIFSQSNDLMIEMRYNSLVLNSTNDELIPSAWDETETLLMGLRHPSLPVHGIQFHPESVGSPDGRIIISAFLRLTPQVIQSGGRGKQASRPQS